MSNNIYVAAPFFTSDQIARAQKVFQLLRLNPTVNQVDGIFMPMVHQNEELAFGSEAWQDATFRSDVRQIDRADAVVAVLDFKNEEQNFVPDSGTMWEVGYAFAHNKPVIMIKFSQEGELNLMLAKSYTAFFDGDDNIDKLKNYDFSELKQIYTSYPVF